MTQRLMGLISVALVFLFVRKAEPLPDRAFARRLGDAVGRDPAFTEADGRRIGFGDLCGGRPIALALGGVRRPSPCSVVRDGLLAAPSRTGLDAGADCDLAAVSIDPASPPRRRAHRRRRGRLPPDHAPRPALVLLEPASSEGAALNSGLFGGPSMAIVTTLQRDVLPPAAHGVSTAVGGVLTFAGPAGLSFAPAPLALRCLPVVPIAAVRPLAGAEPAKGPHAVG